MKVKHTGNSALFIAATLIYAGVLVLFGWQTWGFVNWLFPHDQLLMQVLTLLCFDIMAAVWAIIDLFYQHATRANRTIVQWGWGISFFLSLVASVLYLIIESYTRLKLKPNDAMIGWGNAIVIIAITFTALMLTFWLYREWAVRHPDTDVYAYDKVVRTTEPAKTQDVRTSDPDTMELLMGNNQDVRTSKSNGHKFPKS